MRNNNVVNILIIFILSNFFYVNAILNYKVLVLIGIIFLKKFKKNEILLFLTTLFVITLTTYFYLSNEEDSIKLFYLTFMYVLGAIGWFSLLINNWKYYIPSYYFLILFILGILFKNSLISLDPIIIVFFYIVNKYLFKSDKVTYKDLFFYTLALAMSIIIGWRSATLGLFILCIIEYYRKIPYSSKKYILYFISIIVLVNFYLLYTNLMNVLILTGSGGDPSSGRIAMFFGVLKIIYNHILHLDPRLIFGYGFNSYSEFFKSNLSININIGDFEINSTKKILGSSRLHAHNSIIQTFTDFGLIGLLLYIYLTINFFKKMKYLNAFLIAALLSSLLSGVLYFYSPLFIYIYSVYKKLLAHDK